MLLTENIVTRYHEWRDRRTAQPDFVPRMRRLWSMDRIESTPPPRGRRRHPHLPGALAARYQSVGR